MVVAWSRESLGGMRYRALPGLIEFGNWMHIARKRCRVAAAGARGCAKRYLSNALLVTGRLARALTHVVRVQDGELSRVIGNRWYERAGGRISRHVCELQHRLSPMMPCSRSVCFDGPGGKTVTRGFAIALPVLIHCNAGALWRRQGQRFGLFR